jgi:hypothetical protein
MNKDICALNFRNNCFMNEINSSIISKDFKNIHNALDPELAKNMLIKLHRSTVPHDFTRIFNRELKDVIFNTCKSSFTLYLPVYFFKNPAIKDNSLIFKKLKVVEENGRKVVKEVYEDFGPGIRSVYYVRISSSREIMEGEDKNLSLERLAKFGYTPYDPSVEMGDRPFSLKVGPQADIEVFISFYVSYDYRIREESKGLCEICQKLKNTLLNMK